MYRLRPAVHHARVCEQGKNLRSKKEISHGHLARTLRKKKKTKGPETFIHHFKQNGYYTVGMGKMSHSRDGYHGNHLELPQSWHEVLRAPNNELLKYYADIPYRSFKEMKGKKRGPAFECKDVPDNKYPDGMVADMAVNKLEELAKTDKPFFIAVGFVKPHLPFTAPKKYWDMYDHDKIPLSPNPDKPSKTSTKFLHPSAEFFKQYTHPEKGGVGKRLSDAYARQVIHGNYASISFMDAQVGKVLNKLKELNLDKDTIIVAWGDHGWHLGDHTICGKHSTFERALKSTMIMKTPDMTKPGMATSGLIATVDIYPTLCELAGLAKPKGLDGTSFVPTLNNPNKAAKKAVLSYWRDIISMRTDNYRMAVYDNGKSREIMLFDHRKDPNETINITKQNPEVVSELLPMITKLNKGYLKGLK